MKTVKRSVTRLTRRRASDHSTVGSPYVSRVIEGIVSEGDTVRTLANPAFVLAKQLLAALPIIPTGERVYDLTQQLQVGLLDDVCPLSEVGDHWDECVEAVRKYLVDIGVFGFGFGREGR